MGRGRPVKSDIRQNIIEILAAVGKAYGYQIHKWYNQIFTPCTRENIYYNLKKGVALEELKIEEIKQEKNFPRSNFQLFINGKRVPIKNANVIQNNNSNKTLKKFISTHFSEKNSKKFSQLEKVEPSTNIKRIENKIFYELALPGVKDFEDVSIVKLEGSIELRAIGKNKAYFKIIPISLEIANVSFSKDKLSLEFLPKN